MKDAPESQELCLPTQRVIVKRKEKQEILCFRLSLLLFVWKDGAKGTEGGECFAPAQQVKPFWKGSRETRLTLPLGLREKLVYKWHQRVME